MSPGRTAACGGRVPSLHLNLADVYLRLGEHGSAREHADAGRAALVHITDDGYRAMIHDALERVEQRLSSDQAAGPDR